MIGLANTVIGYVLFGFAHTLPMLFFSRMLAGLGGANISAAQAYIADVTPIHERAKGMGLIGAAFGLGFVFGPVIGGLLSTYGYAVPGFAAAGLSTVALILTFTVLPEPERDISIPQISTAFSLRSFTDTLRKPRIGMLLILFFLVTFAYANIYATFPILARSDFHYGDHEIGFLFGFIGIVGALTQGGLIRLFSGKVKERTLFLVGSAMTMVGLVCIPLSGNTWILHGVLTVLAFGSGLVTPQVLGMISQQAGPAEQGGILGINQSLGALARGLGPLWGGFIFQTAGHPYPFFTGGAVMLVVLLISWRSL
jgi:DHA1 family tetracycline resistance protein-like MFS transporter